MSQRLSERWITILPHAQGWVLSLRAEDLAMMQDNSLPYVLLCSTLGSILSLAAVWISTASTYAPAVVGA